MLSVFTCFPRANIDTNTASFEILQHFPEQKPIDPYKLLLHSSIQLKAGRVFFAIFRF